MNDLEKLAKISYDKFIEHICEDNHLYINKEELENGNTEIEVFYIDENNKDLVGRFYFNQDEEFVGVE